MTRLLFATLFTCVFVSFTSQANTALVDSVGTVIKNGKSFTIHKVAPKETIYALARQYKVPVAQIQQANPGVTALAVGQTIFVPGRDNSSMTSVPATIPATTSSVATTTQANSSSTGSPGTSNPVSAAPANGMHTVTSKQTLFAVARLYNVSTSDLKKWNNLTSDNLKEGQTLIVAAPAAGNAAVSTPTTNTSNTTSAEPAATENEVKAPTTPPATTPVRPVTRREENRPEANVKEERTETRYSETMSRVSESGLAELMDQKVEGNKYLALHKTAPVGTILQVRNTMNNQSVYVRVSGKLPEGTPNDKVIIKVSKRAYQKLAASDNKFRVEVNYMP